MSNVETIDVGVSFCELYDFIENKFGGIDNFFLLMDEITNANDSDTYYNNLNNALYDTPIDIDSFLIGAEYGQYTKVS